MANFVTSGIENLLGLDTTAGTSEMQQAIAALQAVGVPNAAQLTLPQLQQYVSAGVLSPSQYQAIQENPQAYQQAFTSAQDTSGMNAQKSALQQLGGISQAGGSTPINQANLQNNIQQTNQAMQAARQGIQENAQERGVAGGGQEFLSQLLNEQGNAQTANTGAVNAASNNAQLGLQALSQQGTLGGNIQNESTQQAQALAQAAQQIAQYNSQLQSQANQYNTQNANSAQAANLANAQALGNANTQNANMRTEYNAQVPQTVYQDQMGKAQGLAGAYGNMANLKEQQAQSQNQFTGSLIGAGATLGGDYALGQGMGAAAQPTRTGVSGTDAVNMGYGSSPTGVNADPSKYGIPGYAQGGMVQCYAKGGEVHDHALCMLAGGGVPGESNVDGDSAQNDTVPAMLSPHEIVLPKSVAQAPDAPQQAAQFVGQIKGQQAAPNASNFSDVIKMLEANGLELRLGSIGQ